VSRDLQVDLVVRTQYVRREAHRRRRHIRRCNESSVVLERNARDSTRVPLLIKQRLLCLNIPQAPCEVEAGRADESSTWMEGDSIDLVGVPVQRAYRVLTAVVTIDQSMISM